MNEMYRKATGRAHLPDPYLPEPIHDWVHDPWGWTVYTTCGLVLRRSQPVDGAPDLCRKCRQRATQRAAQGTVGT
jgi:hypothetical protein